MTARLLKACALVFVLLLALGGAAAQDSVQTVPYLQTSGFNVPVLAGWDNQSTDAIAQFYSAEYKATIRAQIVALEDPPAAARTVLASWLDIETGPPVYNGKVNLADGTWHVLAFDINAATTASVMARRHGQGSVVISFVEAAPEARTMLLTLAQTDDALNTAAPEIDLALDPFAGVELAQLDDAGNIDMPSGQWQVYERPRLRALGMVFGNDSYIALQEGELGNLAALADAYNRTLLGFFVTPDNSLYLALGLAAAFAVLGLLVLSFFWRSRGIQQELALIETLTSDEE